MTLPAAFSAGNSKMERPNQPFLAGVPYSGTGFIPFHIPYRRKPPVGMNISHSISHSMDPGFGPLKGSHQLEIFFLGHSMPRSPHRSVAPKAAAPRPEALGTFPEGLPFSNAFKARGAANRIRSGETAMDERGHATVDLRYMFGRTSGSQ